MANPVTFYPGIGADEEIARLERLLGKITAYWAQVEDGLFNLFVVALAGTWAVLVMCVHTARYSSPLVHTRERCAW